MHCVPWLRLGECDLGGGLGCIAIEHLAVQCLFSRPCAPRHGRHAAKRYACLPDLVTVHIESDGRRGQRKRIGFAIADLQEARAVAPGPDWNIDGYDDFVGCQICLYVGRIAGQVVQLGEGILRKPFLPSASMTASSAIRAWAKSP